MSKVVLIRLARVVVALALVAGGVGLLRYVGHDLLRATGSMLPEAPREQQATRRPFVYLYRLAEIVPKKLHMTYAGVAPERSERFHEMPLDLAREAVHARLLSQGWQALDRAKLPANIALTMESHNLEPWLTHEQCYAQLELTAVSEARTRERLFILPKHDQVFSMETPTVERSEAEIRDTAVARMREFAQRQRVEQHLPRWMSVLCLGPAMSSRFVARETGASFYITCHVPQMTPQQAQARVAFLAQPYGWRREVFPGLAVEASGMEAEGTTCYARDNLLCFVHCMPIAGGTSISYRFSDDEADGAPFFPTVPTPSTTNKESL